MLHCVGTFSFGPFFPVRRFVITAVPFFFCFASIRFVSVRRNSVRFGSVRLGSVCYIWFHCSLHFSFFFFSIFVFLFHDFVYCVFFVVPLVCIFVALAPRPRAAERHNMPGDRS